MNIQQQEDRMSAKKKTVKAKRTRNERSPLGYWKWLREERAKRREEKAKEPTPK